ncbi:MAG: LON peptidase substrate-binding domain-containing protein [Longimicrobiales bacterium]
MSGNAAVDPRAMFRLPLFPLPVVLFPTASMPLHIFEPRYRRMVARCLEGDRRFGLLHHDADRQGPFLCEEGRVGCVAHIEEFEPLPDGRSVLMVRGLERFHIEDGIESEEPFYEALVAPYVDGEAGDAIEPRRARALALFREVLQKLGEEPDRLATLDAASELSFPLVRAVQAEAGWLQGFLEVRDEEARLELLEQIFLAVLDR